MGILLPCAVCGQEGTFRCGSCRLQHYCSREHQKKDWKDGHKNKCRIFSIETSDKVGRCLVAARDIEPGSIILNEEPLVSLPPLFTQPLCLGCFGSVDSTSPTCEKCGWPMCCEECKRSPHHIPECTYTSNRKEHHHRENAGEMKETCKVNIRDFAMNHPMYKSIPLLRCLYLRDIGDKAWDKLIKLEDHQEERRVRAKESGEDDEDRVVKFTMRYFGLNDSDEADVRKIFGVILVNGHEVPQYAVDGSVRSHVAIYDHGSILEHSCVSNCVKRFTPSGGIEIRVTKFIPKGCHLSISYTDLLWGTIDRQKDLFLNKYFFCDCPRCEDPTELGSFIGALKCPSCTEGYSVPMKSASTETLSDLDKLYAFKWNCVGKPVSNATTANGCGCVMSFEKANQILTSIGNQLINLSSSDMVKTRTFVEDNAEVSLHKNHQFLVAARLGMLQILKDKLSSMDEATTFRDQPERRLLETVCQDLLEVMDLLCPGITEIRGVLMYESCARYVHNLLRQLEKGSNFGKVICKDKVELFREGISILSLGTSNDTYALSAVKGRQLVSKLDHLISRVPNLSKKKILEKK